MKNKIFPILTVIMIAAFGHEVNAQITVTITQPDVVNATEMEASRNNVSCYGGNDGGFIVVADGGAETTYTYSLTSDFSANNNADGVFAGLTAGVYTVYVKDINDCTDPTPINITITEPASALSATISSQTNVLCPEGNEGAVTIAAGGGTDGYIYSLSSDFSNSNTTGLFTGLSTGEYTVYVKDANGCPSTAAVTITSTDNTPPVLSYINEGDTAVVVIIESGNSAAVTVPTPSITDDCDFTFENDYNNTTSADGNYPLGKTTVTWTAVDGNTNEAVPLQQNVYVASRDDFTITCPEDLTLECNPVGFPENIDQVSTTSGSVFWFLTNTSSVLNDDETAYPSGGNCWYKRTRTYTATWKIIGLFGEITQSCDREYYYVKDEEAPSLTVPTANLSIGCNPTLPTVASVVAASSATDNCSTPTITAEAGTITGTCEKSQTFTVTATDDCDNTDVKTVTYTWTDDTEKPVIVDLADYSLEGFGTPWPASVVTTWTDNCSAGGSITGVAGEVVTDGCIQYLDFVFNVSDDCENDAIETVTRVTRSYDIQSPTITCPADISSSPPVGETSLNVTLIDPTVSDNCSPTQDIIVSSERSDGLQLSDPYPLGNTTITYTATDEAGNQNSCTQTITIVSSSAPGGVRDGLQLWLRSDAGVMNNESNAVNNDPVELWDDQFLNHDAKQNNPDNKPSFSLSNNHLINFNPVVIFDGANDFLESDLSSSDMQETMSLFVVCRPSEPGVVVGLGSSSYLAFGENNTVLFSVNGTNNTVSLTDKYAKQEVAIVSCLKNGNANGDIILYKNGNNITGAQNSNASIAPANITRIGQSDAGTISWFNGDIAEVIIYKRCLSPLEKQKVESYLSTKYGITYGEE